MATIVTAWPSQAQYDKALSLAEDAKRAVEDLHLHLVALVDADDCPGLREGADLPTIEDVGRLSVFSACADLTLYGMRSDVDGIGQVGQRVALETAEPGSRAPSLTTIAQQRIAERLGDDV